MEVLEVQECHAVQCRRGHAMMVLTLWDGMGKLFLVGIVFVR